MSFDRSKFVGSKVSVLNAVQKDAKKNDKVFSNNSSRVDFLEVEEGRNVFRLLPAHPDDKIGASYLPKRTAQLKCEVPIYKDGEETGQTEIKGKHIFIATQHGGLPKDPIELYIEYVRSYANDAFDNKDDRTKFLAPITGWKDKKGNWNWGITPKTSYVGYAVKMSKVGRLELWDAWVKEMDKLAINEDANEVIGINPFTDPNEGFPLIITKTKNDKGKFDYAVTKDEPSRTKREGWDEFFARVMVTDEQLGELIKQEPLSSLYGNDIYTKRDWELAIDGLQRFDEENKYGIFENEEFLNELSELEALVPEKKEKKEDSVEKALAPGASKPMAQGTTEKEAEKEVEEDEDAVTIPEMKMALKKFIRKNHGEEAIAQLPTDEKKLRLWYALYEEGEDLPIKAVTKSEPDPEAKLVEKEVVKQAEKQPESGGDPDLSDEIARLRAKRNRG